MAKTPRPTLASLDAHPALAETASHLFYAAALENVPAAFLKQALPLVCQALGGDYLALVKGEKGKWRVLGASGPERPLPTDLLAEVLDSDEAQLKRQWYVTPLSPHSGTGELLAAYRTWMERPEPSDAFVTTAGWLNAALAAVRERERLDQRLMRLQAILEIAARWQQTLEMAPLLEQMAATSTRLLGSERATIFLWDRAAKQLIGRPALGVQGNELRIPDSTGIVGQVIHSGQPRRVDVDVEAEQGEVDRRVDRQLKFHTKSLLCVPLRGRSGELFGAFEVINKIGGNFTDIDQEALVELAAHAAVALENTQQVEDLLHSRKQITDDAAQRVQMIGDCPAVQALRSTVRRVADTDLAVLILGENGTGKEVVAQMIHYGSRRRAEPFVAVNCAAITETLLESELFGHEKGAFTDAREMRQGKFELASKGTLFLDEIGDMSLAGQAKLLRVLEEKIVVRVGGSTNIATNARVLAATNQNLADLVRQKRFREDLYFRLNVVTLDMPPLRDRGDDIVTLAEHFLKHFCLQARRRIVKFTTAAKRRLLAHRWPGNVRELRNLMERLAYLAPDDQDKLDAPDLAFILSPASTAANALSLDAPLTDATQRFQIEYIKRHIEACRGNMTAAAERLGLHRSNLYRKMRQLEMEVDEE
ncbi:Nitrogen fixation protein VnfA [Anatilimnocola aggregata]|uniref:Nitrogen fixation protein VnfA n=1 Tax=Anatilimnocola aggregata TaxID=2528021 RepID=A0A517YM79_9BACT|nr:sigma-54-dependent Fis family transcriptional regulator [Anatilimnocola aggregata]QDU31323.1 Nitrogen fixation protein VnfA [Anatilimnocola aggregata]